MSTASEKIKELSELFAGIRDEKRTAANTATRIGNAILALLSYIEDAPFIRKDMEDTDMYLLRLLKGVVIGDDGQIKLNPDGSAVCGSIESGDFRRGLLDGKGFGIYDELGKKVMELDKILVRQKMILQELEIRKLSYVGGDQVFSSAGSKIVNVRKLTNGDYRCYMLADDGTTRTMNEWRIGDQARCQTDNIKAGVYENISNRYYWRLVVARGTETLGDGKTYHYVDLSDTRGALEITGEDGKTYTCVGYDTSVDNDIPQADDSIVQLGNQTDKERQYAYIIYVSEQKRVDYMGINDYDLASHAVEQHSSKGGFVMSDYFSILSSSGTGVSTPLVCDRGEWAEGMICGHYDRVSHEGCLWLCNVGKGNTTTEEPKEGSSVWIKQVDKGAQGESRTELVLTTSDGYVTTYREGQGYVATIMATAYKGAKDITPEIHPSRLVWKRKTNAGGTDDEDWNARHANIDFTMQISTDDLVPPKTTFIGILYDEHGIESAQDIIDF